MADDKILASAVVPVVATPRAIRIRKKRWYMIVSNENFRDFIKKYDFGFVPKMAVNISASTASPINEILMEKYENLQIVNTYKGRVNIKQMPYEDNSIDILISEMVLEHVSSVWKVPPEIYRVLRVGGITVQIVPFIYPEHGGGRTGDYYRFTSAGLKDLFNEFEVLEVGCSGHQEIADFLMKYRSGHSDLKNGKFENEELASKKIIDKIGKGFIGNKCSNSVWGYFRKGEKH